MGDNAVELPAENPQAETIPIEVSVLAQEVVPEDQTMIAEDTTSDHEAQESFDKSNVDDDTDLPTTDDCGREPVSVPNYDAALNDINAMLETLSRQFASRFQYDEEKEKVIDRQHKELQEYRSGIKRDLLRPVLYDLAQLMDDIRQTKQHYKQLGSDDAIEAVETVEDMVLFLLDKNGVEQVESREGAALTPLQRMVKTVPTDDAAKAKTVAESVSPGYALGAEILYKEKVLVYKYVKPQPVISEQQAVEKAAEQNDEN